MSPALPLQLYKNKTRCQSESIECFLQPLSNCSEEQRLQLPAHMLGRRYYEGLGYILWLSMRALVTSIVLSLACRAGSIPAASPEPAWNAIVQRQD
jgi:hypothetical protein